jgi:CelD/BcsL family acetyltransferase involved in cellulose biosynthesis
MLARTGEIPEASRALTARFETADAMRLTDAKAWDALVAQAAEPNPFLERWFLIPAIDHLPSDDIVRFACVEEDGRLIGMFPLTSNSHYGRMPVSHITNWTHYQCFLGAPLIAKGHEQAFWSVLLTALDAAPWATSFISLTLLDPAGPVCAGLIAAAAAQGRTAPIVHRHQRALLAGGMDAEAYLSTHVRGKKRKEWRRLANRLEDLGAVEFRVLDDAGQLAQWCDDFLALEAAGWKGERGAALGNHDGTRAFFTNMMAGALAAGRLEFQRLDLDGRAIAMLINFMTPPGSWSFKIAYDEELARFSPGVMIELRNMERVLGAPEIHWMDSCAIEDHPMIDSLWVGRREMVQISVPLFGLRRKAAWIVCRAAETGFARFKNLNRRAKSPHKSAHAELVEV